jgi:hypothetical protein
MVGCANGEDIAMFEGAVDHDAAADMGKPFVPSSTYGSGGASSAGGGGAQGTGGLSGKGGASGSGGNAGTGTGGGTGGATGSGGSSFHAEAGVADAPLETTTKGETGPPPTGITLLYKCTDTNPTDSQIGPSYKLVDTGGPTVNLSDFRIRYYLTNEAKTALLSDFLYAEVNGGPGYRDIRSDATVKVMPMTPASTGADTYVDISFNAAAGTLVNGQTCTVNFTVHTEGFATNLNEADDYSHDLARSDFGPNDKVTLYYQDKLVAGTEP